MRSKHGLIISVLTFLRGHVTLFILTSHSSHYMARYDLRLIDLSITVMLVLGLPNATNVTLSQRSVDSIRINPMPPLHFLSIPLAISSASNHLFSLAPFAFI